MKFSGQPCWGVLLGFEFKSGVREEESGEICDEPGPSQSHNTTGKTPRQACALEIDFPLKQHGIKKLLSLQEKVYRYPR